MINQQYNIIRLASIDAAFKGTSIPEKFVEEKSEIIEKLREEKMLIMDGDKFSFVDEASDLLYQESFNEF